MHKVRFAQTGNEDVRGTMARNPYRFEAAIPSHRSDFAVQPSATDRYEVASILLARNRKFRGETRRIHATTEVERIKGALSTD